MARLARPLDGAAIVGVVGAGIVGLAVARAVGRRYPGTEIVVLEREDRLGAHQTGHSSGVVHAGIYYPPGSLKAELCVRGRDLLREFCQEHAVPYQECGKLVVAVDPGEIARLDALERTASQNRVPGLRRLGPGELDQVEPQVTGLAALHSPSTAITDYVAVARALASEVRAGGGRVLMSSPVTGIDRVPGGVQVRCGASVHRVDRLVLCGGVQADRLGRLAGDPPGPRIVPFRGEYLTVEPAHRNLVRGMVYPVPDPGLPFLGVHLTRRITGELDIGPNAVLATHRDAPRRGAVRVADVVSTLSWPGSWRMAGRHWRTGLTEIRGSLSVPASVRLAARYVPALADVRVDRAGFGVRAQAVDRDGALVDDFRILSHDGIVSVRNAPSPAATASLAIAEHVVDHLARDA